MELRLDRCDPQASAWVEQLAALSNDFPRLRFVGTCRFAADLRTQIALLEGAGAAGLDAVDLPLELEDPVELPEQVLRIHSWHQEEEGAVDLTAVVSSLAERARPQDFLKIVTWADYAEDAWPTLELYRDPQLPVPPDQLLAFAQGPGGTASRLLSVHAGAPFLYCAWPGEATAPGQLTMHGAIEVLPTEVEASTPVLGVVGNPVDHSLSPFLWRRARVLADQEAPTPDLLYLKFRVADLPRFLPGALGYGVRGLSVTAPHKQAAYAAASTSTPVASECGAANLLLAKEVDHQLTWHADHTDGVGALDALEQAGLDAASSLLLLGAGGAAQAVASEGIRRGYRINMASRRRPGSLPARAVWTSLDDARPSRFDAVLQATPVGSVECPGMLCPQEPPREGALALDMVYHPLQTDWLLAAEESGARTLKGTAMLVHQMAAQYARVFPDADPVQTDSLLHALEQHLDDRTPVVLVGARASGKSTLARALAARLGWDCLDADVLLARQAGRDLASWIAEDEPGFRDAEEALLPTLLATPYAIVATGGGVVTRQASRARLQQAARVVYLTCPPEVLWSRQQKEPRPALRDGSLKEEIDALLVEREEHYRQVADHVISTNAEQVSGVMEVIERFDLKGFGSGFR